MPESSAGLNLVVELDVGLANFSQRGEQASKTIKGRRQRRTVKGRRQRGHTAARRSFAAAAAALQCSHDFVGEVGDLAFDLVNTETGISQGFQFEPHVI